MSNVQILGGIIAQQAAENERLKALLRKIHDQLIEANRPGDVPPGEWFEIVPSDERMIEEIAELLGLPARATDSREGT